MKGKKGLKNQNIENGNYKSYWESSQNSTGFASPGSPDHTCWDFAKNAPF